MSEGESNKKVREGGGWGGFASLGASLMDMGNQMEEKMRAQQAVFQEQHAQSHGMGDSKHGLGGSKHGGQLSLSRHGGSKHGMSGSRHSGGGGLMARLGGGLKQREQAASPPKVNEEKETLSTPTPSRIENNNNASLPAKKIPKEVSSSSGATPLAARSPDDVSKEELLEILKKMNARVKALSQSRVQLSEKVKGAEKDKSRLINLVKNEILDEGVIVEASEKVAKLQPQQNNAGAKDEGKYESLDEIIVLQTAWRAADERNQLTLQHIQNEYKVMTLQSQAEVEKVRATLTAEKDLEIARIKADMKEALENVEKDGDFGFGNNGGTKHRGEEWQENKNGELLQKKDEEIVSLKEEIKSLKAVAHSAGALGSPPEDLDNREITQQKEEEISSIKEKMNPPKALGVASATTAECTSDSVDCNRREAKKEKENEIATLKKENQGLRVKFKGHIDKVHAYKQKMAVEIKHAKDEAASKAKEVEKTKEALEEIQIKLNDASAVVVPSEILAEKEKRIRELERILSEFNLVHVAGVEKAREDLSQKPGSELLEVLDTESAKADTETKLGTEVQATNTRMQLNAAVERVRVETMAEECHWEAIRRARAEATDSAPAETAPFRDEYQDVIAETEGKHVRVLDDEPNKLEENYAAALEECRPNSHLTLDEVRSQEAARLKSNLKRARDEAREEVQKEMGETLLAKLAQAEDAHAMEMHQFRETLKKDLITEAESKHAARLEQQISNLNNKHEARLEQVKLELLAMVKSSQSRQIDQLMTSSKAELERVKSEIKIQHASALEEQVIRLTSQHTVELEKRLAGVALSSLEELDRARAATEDHRVSEVKRSTIELKELHTTEVEKVKGDLMTIASSSQTEQLEHLATSHNEEMTRVRSQMEDLASQALDAKTQELTMWHSMEVDKLREDLQSSASEEIERVQTEAEQQHLSEVQVVTKKLQESHSVEVEKVKSDILAMANSSQSEQLEQLAASHRDEIARMHSEMEALASETIGQTSEQLLASYARETEKLQAKLQLSASLEVQRAQFESEQHHRAEVQRITYEMSKSHVAELHRVKSDMLAMVNSSQSEKLKHLAASHKEELARVRAEMEVSASKAISQNTEHLSASHARETEKLRAALSSLSSEQIKRIQAGAEEQRVVEAERIINELKESNAAELQKVKAELEQLTGSHDEEIARVRAEMEETAAQAIAQTTQQQSAYHAQEIENLRAELQASSAEEIQCHQAAAEAKQSAGIGRITEELKKSFEEQIHNVKTNCLMQLEGSQKEEIGRMHAEMKISASQALEKKTQQMLQSHTTQIVNLKAELERKHKEDTQRMANEFNEHHLAEIERIQSDMMALANSSQSVQLEVLVASHKEEMTRVQVEGKQQHKLDVDRITNEMKASHAEEMDIQKTSLIAAAKKKHLETEEKMKELCTSHRAETSKLCDEIANLSTRNMNLLAEQERMQSDFETETLSLDENLLALKNESEAKIRALEEEMEEMNTCHEDKIKSVQEGINGERKAADEKLMHDLMLKSKELEKVQADLKTSEKKAAQAIQLANKIKKAAADKMQTINEEHATALAEAKKVDLDAQSSLEAEAESLRKSVEELRKELETSKTEHDGKLADMMNTATISLDNKMKQISKEHRAAITQLKKDHNETIAKVGEDHKAIMAKVQTEHQSKVDALIQESDASKAKLQKMMAKHADDLKAHYEKKFKSVKNENEVYLKQTEEDTASLKKKEENLTKVVASLKSEGETLQNTLRDHTVKERKLLQQIEGLKMEISDVTTSAKKNTNQMLEHQANMEEHIKQLQSERGHLANKNEELSGKLKALSSNLSFLVEDKTDLEENLERLKKMLQRYKNVESELNILRQENNVLKLEQTKTNSALAKLKLEQDANQLKHGQRTALVGMLEEQVADLNDSLNESKAKLEVSSYDLSQKEEENESLKRELEKAESAMDSAQNKAAENAMAAQQNTEKDSMQKLKMIKTFKAQIDNLQNQLKKKSTTAQKMIKEREQECAELRKTNRYLQSEVDKGSLSDRRIFELAAQQSNRETAAVAEIEIRDKMIERLAYKLEEGDIDLASAELTVVKAEDQVEELARVHRREGVNMDYLKGTVVQYLAKPPGSSERSALLPVIATLLQFDANDYKAIEEGKQKVSWWGDIIPTYINGPTEESTTPAPSMTAQQATPLLPTSAEVTVSSINQLSQHRREGTSLQF